MSDKCKFIEILNNRKLKATPARIKLLETIAEFGHAMPYSRIQRALVDFDRVTLYRSLNTLIDKGIVHKASSSGDETYYAICSCNCTSEKHNHKHIHFKCTNCKSVFCAQMEQAVNISIQNFKIDNIEIEATGLCEDCSKV